MKKICFYILIFSFLNYIGCYSSRNVNKEILYTQDLGEPIKVVAIITNDDKKIDLSEGIYEVAGDTLYVKEVKQHTYFQEQIDVKIALDDIQYVEIEEIDDFATTGCVIGVAALTIFIVLVIAAVNSFDNSPKKCLGPE